MTRRRATVPQGLREQVSRTNKPPHPQELRVRASRTNKNILSHPQELRGRATPCDQDGSGTGEKNDKKETMACKFEPASTGLARGKNSQTTIKNRKKSGAISPRLARFPFPHAISGDPNLFESVWLGYVLKFDQLPRGSADRDAAFRTARARATSSRNVNRRHNQIMIHR